VCIAALKVHFYNNHRDFVFSFVMQRAMYM
jgi:hypothetical protein